MFLPLASSPAGLSAASVDRARRAISVQFLTCPEAAPPQIMQNLITTACNHNANDAKQPHPQVATPTNQHDATGTATENHSDLEEHVKVHHETLSKTPTTLNDSVTKPVTNSQSNTN